MHAPTTLHLQAVKRILQFEKGTVSHGILFRGGPINSLLAYVDADWAGDYERRSISRYSVFLSCNLISFSPSSTESEYRSLAHATVEIIWLGFLLRDLHIHLKRPPLLLCDNLSATYMVKIPIFHARTKHI